MKNKLFIIEGLPCSGKSGVSDYVAELLSNKEQTILYYDEGKTNHPADYEFHAYLKEDDFKDFDNEDVEIIKKDGRLWEKGYILPLSSIQGELFDKVIPYKIYDCLPWDKELPVMLQHWKDFSAQAQKEDNIYVFNCCFLQNPLCETMMRFDFPYETISNYVSNLYEIIKNLDPVIIYLKTDHVKTRIFTIAKERDEEWLEGVIHYHTSQGYGKNHGLSGFDGYISCLEERQERELRILEDLPLSKLILENPFEDWDKSRKQIAKYLQI